MEAPKSEFVFVNRTVGVPVHAPADPETPRVTDDGSVDAVPPPAPPPPVRARKPLTGETKLLLIQIAAALLLAAAVVLGVHFGGDAFRARYASWVGDPSIDLNAWLQPIEPAESSETPAASAPDSSIAG